MNSKLGKALTALPLALLIATPAFGQEEEQQEKRTTVVTQETTKLTVRFIPVQETGVTGSAVILPLETEDEIRFRPIQVELSGLTAEADAQHAVLLYRGSCEKGGTPLGRIGSVAAAETGATGTLKLTEADWQRAAERAGAEEEHAEKHAELAEEKRELEEEHAEEHAEDEDFEEAGLEARPGLFIQVQAPDGTPVACGDLNTETPLFVPEN